MKVNAEVICTNEDVRAFSKQDLKLSCYLNYEQYHMIHAWPSLSLVGLILTNSYVVLAWYRTAFAPSMHPRAPGSHAGASEVAAHCR